MVPWLLLQGLLGILLAVLALYYLVVFPDKSDCFQYAGLSQNTAVSRNYHPYQQVQFCIFFKHFLKIFKET